MFSVSLNVNKENTYLMYRLRETFHWLVTIMFIGLVQCDLTSQCVWVIVE